MKKKVLKEMLRNMADIVKGTALEKLEIYDENSWEYMNAIEELSFAEDTLKKISIEKAPKESINAKVLDF